MMWGADAVVFRLSDGTQGTESILTVSLMSVIEELRPGVDAHNVKMYS